MMAVMSKTVLYATEAEGPICDLAEQNFCQGKGAGGHPATIFSTLDGSCMKQIHSKKTQKEINFYEEIADLCSQSMLSDSLCKIFPEYRGVCYYKGIKYFKMENIKHFSEPTDYMHNPWVLDFKIGSKTASVSSMRKSGLNFLVRTFWKTIHVFQDQYLSSSARYGFRFAGLSGERGLKYSKSLWYKFKLVQKPMKPLSLFLKGFENSKVTDCFEDKLMELQKTISASSFQRLHLVGSSLLFAYDRDNPSKGCQVRLIDFANSYIYDRDDSRVDYQLKYTDKFRRGIKNLRKHFSVVKLHK